MADTNKRYALIVAGGIGSRMKSDVPKQFIKLNKLPILMHTILLFSKHVDKIWITLPETEINHWKTLVNEHQFHIDHEIIIGGETRFHSVKNGLNTIKDENGLVAIHDGVRPFVSNDVIEECFKQAQSTGSGVAAVTPKDSIRVIENTKNKALERNNIRLIQTPQTFSLKEIKKAFETEYTSMFTDDASVFEAAGKSITLVESDYENIKITTPEDLEWAEIILDKRNRTNPKP